MDQIKNWLIVESFPNWEVDRKNGFSYFGLTPRFEKLASFCRERQDSAVESLFLAFFAASFACASDVRRGTYQR